jgi:hypothetical protein
MFPDRTRIAKIFSYFEAMLDRIFIFINPSPFPKHNPKQYMDKVSRCSIRMKCQN